MITKILASCLLLPILSVNMSPAAEVRSHRGNVWGHPEHTLESYNDVINAGAQVIEIDVQMTSDGVPVCLHDATLERTTTGKGLVADHTLAQIKRLDAGARAHAQFSGRSIPTLREALEFIKLKRAKVLIEPKVNAAQAIITAVDAAGFPDDRIALLLYTPGSISPAGALTQYQYWKPAWEYWLVSGGTPTSAGGTALAALKAQGWDGLSFWPNAFTPEDFSLAHFHGLKVGVYGVDAANVTAYVDSGADLLLTDNPGLLSNSLMEGYVSHMYAEFMAKHAVPDTQRARSADPDGDGLSNAEEAIYDTLPLQASETPVENTLVFETGGTPDQRFLRLSLPGWSMESCWVSLEQSSDLLSWRDAEPDVAAEDHSAWPADGAWRFAVNLSGPSVPSCLFFRAKVHFFPRGK